MVFRVLNSTTAFIIFLTLRSIKQVFLTFYIGLIAATLSCGPIEGFRVISELVLVGLSLELMDSAGVF